MDNTIEAIIGSIKSERNKWKKILRRILMELSSKSDLTDGEVSNIANKVLYKYGIKDWYINSNLDIVERN